MQAPPTADDRLLSRAAARSTATLHEAAKNPGHCRLGSSLSHCMCVCAGVRIRSVASGDNLWIHHAIYAASAGDVLVVDTGDSREHGYWGEVMVVAAQARGLAGIVLTGGVRDSQRILELEFPVFSATACIRGTDKNVHGKGALGEPVYRRRPSATR